MAPSCVASGARIYVSSSTGRLKVDVSPRPRREKDMMQGSCLVAGYVASISPSVQELYR